MPDFFDVYGFDADFGNDPFWHVDENNTDPDNGTNALHTVSDGNQLDNFFSRVAILNEGVFFGEDVELSADLTWDDLGGDATDNAGLYVRFNGDSDVGLENEFYHVRVGGDNGPPSSINLHKVIDGFEQELIDQTDDPVPVSAGETHNLRVKVETVGETAEISVWLDDEPVTGMDPFVDEVDAILGPGRVGVGQETNPTYFDNITIIAAGLGGTRLQAGDANQDLEFNFDDILLVLGPGKFETGQAATWAEGDWDAAPGGSPGNPPVGDGEFDFNDILSALAHGLFETGPYGTPAAAIQPGTPDDGKVKVVYDPDSGEVSIAAEGNTLSGIQIVSEGSIFTGDPAQNLGGPFDVDRDDKIAKAVFGESFGDISFGNVAQTGLAQDFLAGDLTATGTLFPSGALSADEIDLIVIPEPTSLTMATLAIVGLLVVAWRRRRGWHE